MLHKLRGYFQHSFTMYVLTDIYIFQVKLMSYMLRPVVNLVLLSTSARRNWPAPKACGYLTHAAPTTTSPRHIYNSSYLTIAEFVCLFNL